MIFETGLDSLVRAAMSNGSFSREAFFSKWFYDSGSSYFFLFKKNLDVTNIQFAELLALVRVHTRSDEPGFERVDGKSGALDLQFNSPMEFNHSVGELVDGFDLGSSPKFRSSLLERLYWPVLRRIVVVSSYFGSCAIHLPPHLTLDIQAVCAESGYVHSCGRAVYISDLDRATKGEFFDAMRRYVQDHTENRKRSIFRVYAHEDFSGESRQHVSELRHGLDEVKLFVEKFYVGGADSLVNVLNELGGKLGDRLEIPEPGNYEKTWRELETRKHNIDFSHTFWLIRDRSVAPEPESQEYARHLICYDQQYKNSNQFHIFDENKPAWIAHTTLPHTLVSAMINITRPRWPEGGVVLGDPFVGSGTTFLEALKFERLQVVGSDASATAELLTQDNLHFFSLGTTELEEIEKDLETLEQLLGTKEADLQSVAVGKGYARAEDLVKAMRPVMKSELNELAQDTVTELRKMAGVRERILFYLALRAEIRHVGARERGAEDWTSGYRLETKTLLLQVNRLLKLMKRAQGSDQTPICLFQGKWSMASCISRKMLEDTYRFSTQRKLVEMRDVREIETGKFDLIVTDPPYGINTDADIERLAELYCQAIPKMIEALKDYGQLVLCLPERSRIGRRSPFFTHREIVTQQVLAAAAKLDCVVSNRANALPSTGGLFRAPYYWESERAALRRAILHFQIRRMASRERELAGRHAG